MRSGTKLITTPRRSSASILAAATIASLSRPASCGTSNIAFALIASTVRAAMRAASLPAAKPDTPSTSTTSFPRETDEQASRTLFSHDGSVSSTVAASSSTVPETGHSDSTGSSRARSRFMHSASRSLPPEPPTGFRYPTFLPPAWSFLPSAAASELLPAAPSIDVIYRAAIEASSVPGLHSPPPGRFPSKYNHPAALKQRPLSKRPAPSGRMPPAAVTLRDEERASE